MAGVQLLGRPTPPPSLGTLKFPLSLSLCLCLCLSLSLSCPISLPLSLSLFLAPSLNTNHINHTNHTNHTNHKYGLWPKDVLHTHLNLRGGESSCRIVPGRPRSAPEIQTGARVPPLTPHTKLSPLLQPYVKVLFRPNIQTPSSPQCSEAQKASGYSSPTLMRVLRLPLCLVPFFHIFRYIARD